MCPRARPVALTIAGSDSGGGAGIQADLKTFHAFGVYGASAVTAVTAQDTRGVHAVHPIPPDVVRRQIEVVAEDLAPAAAKTGMLATEALVLEVADALERRPLPHLVVDPVMVSTSGHALLDPGAEAAVARRLLPLASLVTPNLQEAERLTGIPVRGLDDMEKAARLLVEMGARAALVKGGHLTGASDAVDVLWDGAQLHVWRNPRLDTRHTHGTGCTLSAAVTAGLALGMELPAAAARAVRYVARALAGAPGLGGGRGPLDHFASTS